MKEQRISDGTPEQDAKFASVRANLEACLNQHTRDYQRSIAAAVLVPVVLIASAYLVQLIFSSTVKSSWIQIFGLVALVAAFVIDAVLILVAVFALDEKKSAKWRLETLEKEAESTRVVLNLANSGRPFALFLRSFAAERQGMGDGERRKGDVWRGMATWRAAKRGEWYEADTEHLIANSKWHDELSALKAIEARLPVVLLGNTLLDPGMRNDLAGAGITELTIQAQDWWSIFATLCSRASITIVYVKQPSPMLVREMQHLHSQHLRYVLFGDANSIRLLADATGFGDAVVSDAAAQPGESYLEAIPNVLDHILQDHSPRETSPEAS